MPSCCVDLRTLGNYLATPAIEQPVTHVREPQQDDLNGDTEETLAIVPSKDIFFKVIWKDVGRKKVPKVSLAAGSRLAQNDTAIAIYKQLEDSKSVGRPISCPCRQLAVVIQLVS